MNDYDTPEIRCSLRNLSRVTKWLRTEQITKPFGDNDLDARCRKTPLLDRSNFFKTGTACASRVND